MQLEKKFDDLLMKYQNIVQMCATKEKQWIKAFKSIEAEADQKDTISNKQISEYKVTIKELKSQIEKLSQNQIDVIHDKLKSQIFKLTQTNKDLKEQLEIKKVMINNLQLDLARKASPSQKAGNSNKMELINTRQANEKLKEIISKWESKEQANLASARAIYQKLLRDGQEDMGPFFSLENAIN